MGTRQARPGCSHVHDRDWSTTVTMSTTSTKSAIKRTDCFHTTVTGIYVDREFFFIRPLWCINILVWEHSILTKHIFSVQRAPICSSPREKVYPVCSKPFIPDRWGSASVQWAPRHPVPVGSGDEVLATLAMGSQTSSPDPLELGDEGLTAHWLNLISGGWEAVVQPAPHQLKDGVYSVCNETLIP